MKPEEAFTRLPESEAIQRLTKALGEIHQIANCLSWNKKTRPIAEELHAIVNAALLKEPRK